MTKLFLLRNVFYNNHVCVCVCIFNVTSIIFLKFISFK